jgi:hypothetical protein
MSFGVATQQFSRGIEMCVLANAGENVERLPVVGSCVLHSIRGDNRQTMQFRQITELLIDPIFAPQEMALDFDDNIVVTKDVNKKWRAFRRVLGSAGCQPAPSGSLPDGNFVGTCKTRRCLRQAAANCRLAACAPQSEECNQPVSVLR